MVVHIDPISPSHSPLLIPVHKQEENILKILKNYNLLENLQIILHFNNEKIFAEIRGSISPSNSHLSLQEISQKLRDIEDLIEKEELIESNIYITTKK